MLICKNLNKSYSDGNNSIDILSNINLNISSGETVAITGASGSGKSTLLHILSTLDNADSGEINLDGHLISGLDDNKLSKIRLTKIGFIYQFHHLIKELSVKENISLPLYIAKKSNTDIEKIVNEVIDQVDMTKRKDFQLDKLSGGERQRVAIARSIVNKPKIIFADEPTGNLDKKNANNIFSLLNVLVKNNKSSLIMATHDLDVALKLNRNLKIDNGQLKDI